MPITELKKTRFGLYNAIALLSFILLLTGCGSDTSAPSSTNTNIDVDVDVDVDVDTGSSNNFYNQDSSVGTVISTGNFNLTTLTASNIRNDDESGNIRQVTLTWENAFTENTNSTTYTICQTDNTQISNCSVLGTVTNTLSYTVELNSVLDAVDQSYFVLADNATDEATSSVKSIHPGEFSKIAGYFKASNTGSTDDFGKTVVISGDGLTMAVAAEFEDSDSSGIDGTQTDSTSGGAYGAVYIYSSDSQNNWSQTAYIKAENSDIQDYFGTSLALNEDGSTLAVGAIGEDSASVTDEDDNSINDAGAVYIFSNNGSHWEQSAYLKNTTPSDNDKFGYAVSLNNEGDRLAVGAAYQTTTLNGASINQSGAVALFDSNSDQTSWTQIAALEATNPSEKDRFGAQVSLNGDGGVLAIGAYLEDSSETVVNGDGENNDAKDAGAVYIFSESSSLNWSQTAYLKASNAEEEDYFGWSLTLNDDGDVLAVGASYESSSSQGIDKDSSNNDAKGSGAIYIFNYTDSNSTWNETAYIKASNAETYASEGTRDPTNAAWGDHFGRSVAFNGDGTVLAVGAPNEDSAATGINWDESNNEEEGSGTVYLFKYNNQTWNQDAYIKSPNPEKLGYFGFNVSLSSDGKTLAVGALNESSNTTGINGEYTNLDGDDATNENYSGAVYLY